MSAAAERAQAPGRGGPADALFLQEALAGAASLHAAQQLGVLERLAAEPMAAAALARACGIGERGARALLRALAALAVVSCDGHGAYHLEGGAALVARALALWDRLPDAVRDDRPVRAFDTPDGAAAEYPAVVPWLSELVAQAAATAADRLVRPGLRVLDVGAGAAPWSLALASREPDVTVTAVDFPAVLQATGAAVAAAGRERQFRYLAGNVFELDLGGPYDLVILGNVCHLFGAEANRRLLEALYEVLQPGGTLAILDVLPNEESDRPRAAVLYALSLLLRTEQGQVYPFSTYVSWLREAGYEAVDRFDPGQQLPLHLITAGKPA